MWVGCCADGWAKAWTAAWMTWSPWTRAPRLANDLSSVDVQTCVLVPIVLGSMIEPRTDRCQSTHLNRYARELVAQGERASEVDDMEVMMPLNPSPSVSPQASDFAGGGGTEDSSDGSISDASSRTVAQTTTTTTTRFGSSRLGAGGGGTKRKWPERK